MTTSTEELWRHPDPTSTPMWRFLLHVNQKYGLQLAGYPDLYKWSVENAALFWGEVWHFVGIKASKGYDKVRLAMCLCMIDLF
jgi:acetoacetyl-CoA synthetase